MVWYLIGLIIILLFFSVRIVQQYERGVVFRLGKVQGGVRHARTAFYYPDYRRNA